MRRIESEMGDAMRARTWGSFVVTAALAVLLTGCLLLPGRFTSDLTLKKDGSFGFTYKGEIVVLALSRMAAGMNEQAANKPFEPKDCKEDDGDTVRPCKPEDETDHQLDQRRDEGDPHRLAEFRLGDTRRDGSAREFVVQRDRRAQDDRADDGSNCQCERE